MTQMQNLKSQLISVQNMGDILRYLIEFQINIINKKEQDMRQIYMEWIEGLYINCNLSSAINREENVKFAGHIAPSSEHKEKQHQGMPARDISRLRSYVIVIT